MAQDRDGTEDIQKWLKTNHRVVPSSDLNADEVHIFATRVAGVFANDEFDEIYDISFNLGPIVYKLEVYFDLTGHKFSVWAFYEIPFIPAIKLGYAAGNTDDRITIRFDKVTKGRLDFSIKDNWLWLHYDVSFKRNYAGDIKLIPHHVPNKLLFEHENGVLDSKFSGDGIVRRHPVATRSYRIICQLIMQVPFRGHPRTLHFNMARYRRLIAEDMNNREAIGLGSWPQRCTYAFQVIDSDSATFDRSSFWLPLRGEAKKDLLSLSKVGAVSDKDLNVIAPQSNDQHYKI